MAAILDTLAGAVLVPVVGAVGTNLLSRVAGPAPSDKTIFWIGAATHAAVGVGSWMLADRYQKRGSDNAPFFRGGAYGEGVIAAFLAANPVWYKPPQATQAAAALPAAKTSGLADTVAALATATRRVRQ